MLAAYRSTIGGFNTNVYGDYTITSPNDDYYNIKFQEKPLMIWIWISVLMISLGGLKSLIKKN